MKAQKSNHDIVLRQLQQYSLSKRLIAEYEEIHLNPRSDDTPVIQGETSDPTGNRAVHLIDPDARMRQVYGWVWAIERAYENLTLVAPDKATLMECLFGLNEREVMYATVNRREDLMKMLHVSEPTLYRWREEIINAVMLGAIQADVISPYETDRRVKGSEQIK